VAELRNPVLQSQLGRTQLARIGWYSCIRGALLPTKRGQPSEITRNRRRRRIQRPAPETTLATTAASTPQFADSIDLLRNEKPVYFHWNDTSRGVRLSTANEPIGEGTDMGF